MKKLMSVITVLFLLVVLAACGDTGDVTITPPSLSGVTVDNTDPFDGSNYELYYKEKNESTLIGIELNNPSNLEIRAIYINGYSYRYNTFTDDSTNNQIYFYMTSGENLEETAYTVDEIEYFDGADTRDVIVNTNNEFHLYVYKDLPSVNRESYSVNQDEISVDFTVIDEDAVIDPASLVVKIFEGTTELTDKTQTLSTGFNSITFTNLKTETNYDIKVYADYDLDDTNGVREEVVLFSGNFTTYETSVPKATISNLEKTSDSVSFDLEFIDVDDTSIPGTSRIEVYDQDILVKTVSFTGDDTHIVLDGLFNSKEYTLFIKTNYDLRDGFGTKTDSVLAQTVFTTTAREIPTPAYEGIVVEENRILFDFIIEDDEINPIIDLSTLVAEVYVDDEENPQIIFISDSRVEIQVNDILSGRDIRIEFYATVDLNDGNGPQEHTYIDTFEKTSLLNEVPYVVVHDVIVTQGYIQMDLLVLDPSESLLGSVRAILYEVSEVENQDGSISEVETYISTQYLETTDVEAIFAHLIESQKNYRIKILADYNLKDGAGNKTNETLYTHEVTSMQPKAPASEIQDITVTNSGMSFNAVVMDADNTIIPNSIYLYVYKDGVLLESYTQNLLVGDNTISLTNLNSDYVYDIEVRVDYDVLDGSDTQLDILLVTKDVKTLAKEIPSAVLSEPDSDTESIVFDVNISDPDNVIEPGTLKAILYYNNVPTGAEKTLIVGDNFGVTFDGILSDTMYKIGIVVDYDLDNGEGIVEGLPLGDFNIETEPKFAPEAELRNIEETTDTITFDVIITDVYDVITGTPKALLYIGDTYTGQSVDLSLGVNLNKQFTNVYSNTNFVIYIVSSYNLNDNVNSFTDKELTYDFAETKINEMVTGDLYNFDVGIDTLTFSAVITDNDNVVTDNLKAILYLKDNTGEYVATGDYIDLVVGDNKDKVFTNLISDSEYKVELRTDFSLRDTIGEEENFFLDSHKTTTDAYTAPTGYVTNLSTTINTLRFDTVIADISDTSVGQYRAILYYDGAPEGQTATLNEGLTQFIEFTGLFSGANYEIKIEAVYDLLDGNNAVTSNIYDATYLTEARLAPVGSASGLSVDEDSISFIFNYVDVDSTLVENTFKVWLYDEDLNLIDEKNLYDDEVYFDVSHLISDFAVIIRVTGDYDLQDGSPEAVDDGVLLTLDLRTHANEIPFVSMSNVQYNQNDITVDVSITDEDNVIKGDLFAVLYDNEHQEVSRVAITNLNQQVVFSNVTITVREWYNIMIEGDIDLRDGNLTQPEAVLGEKAIMTYNNVLPQAHIFNQVVTTSSITFDATIYDNYSTYVGNARAVLYKDGVPTGDSEPLGIGTTATPISFTNLTSNGDYEVRILLDYDNANLNGTQTDYLVLIEEFHVLQRQIPTAEITMEQINKEDIILDVLVTDPDNVITGNLFAIIYKGGLPTGNFIPLDVLLNDDETISSLLSNTNYEVKIIADYDLQDGETVVVGEVLDTQEFDTLSITPPTAIFSNITSDTGSITFDLDIVDPDLVVTGNMVLRLYRNNVYTGITQAVTQNDNDGLTFTNLYSDSTYYVELALDYNLRDGLGLKQDQVLANASTVTYPNSSPDATIGSTSSTVNSITFTTEVFDDDSTITGNLQAVLYVNGFPTGDVIPLTVGAPITETFSGLFSNRDYQVKIEADYDLRDGSPASESSVLANVYESTKAKVTPNAIINSQTVTNTSITLDIDVTDPDVAIVGQAWAELFQNGTTTGQIVQLVVGNNPTVSFTGLDYGTEYEVQILTDFNNNIGNPDEEDYLLASTTISTQALITVNGVTTEVDDVFFNVVLDDEFGILDDEYLTLKIYDESDTLSGTYYLEGSGTVDILHYLNNHTYRVEIEANVTNEGIVKVYEQVLAIPERALQFVSIGEIGVNGTDISTNIAIELPDPNGVITGPVTVVLYELQGGVYVEVDSETLLDGDNSVIFNTFDGTDGTSYMLRVEATCNFNDGTGDQTDYIISTRTFIYTTQN